MRLANGCDLPWRIWIGPLIVSISGNCAAVWIGSVAAHGGSGIIMSEMDVRSMDVTLEVRPKKE